MNKIIKFRAWNTIDKNWEDYFQVDPNGRPMTGVENDEVNNSLILSQYIGLEDKNGKKIYEGDVLEWPEYKRKHLVLAKYWEEPEQALNGFILVPNKGWCMGIDRDWLNRAVIIGNIYQDPDLLA